MPTQPVARIFVSYSRKDGAAFAADLRKRLEAQDLSIWQDIVALEGGRDWWSQIEDALKSKGLQHFVLVITPTALASAVVRREIRLARQEGKTVCPVKGPGLADLGSLPRWLGQIYDLDLTEHWTTLTRVLQDQGRQKRVPMMAPEPPTDFVQRPQEFQALKQQLLDAKGDAVAITAALRGAGGYGKTTLAKALAHDPDIQDAYFDGILWIELGEKPENLLGAISDLVARLTGEPPGVQTIGAAASALGEALGDRRILMIVDDAWREQDLSPFLRGGAGTTRLITTRMDNVLPADAQRQTVDAMKDREALRLLAWGLPEDQVTAQRRELGDIASRVGEWALLLKLVNGFLRDRVRKSNQPLREAILGVNKRLDEKGLLAFDARSTADRTRAVARTIRVSLDLLQEGDRRVRFCELGVFPEDADVPVGIVARLWAESGGLDEIETEDLLSELYGLSLLLNLDLDRRIIRLHDIVRQFLREEGDDESLCAQNRRLLRALDDIGASDDAKADQSTRRYFYLHRMHHLSEAEDRRKIDELLLDPRWLQAKLQATGSPQSLVADYERHGAGQAQNLIGRILRLTAGICTRDPRQLLPQLLGRLMAAEGIAATGFLDAARLHLPTPVIFTQRPTLTPPGAEAARLEGHSGPVSALCVLPDGRLASSSSHARIRLWDVTSGAEAGGLEGHSEGVFTLCVLPDGRLASGSWDHTIRLWDVTSGAETARLEGHSQGIFALCVLPDGRLASGSWDDTIRLWDVTSGAETARLAARSRGVTALCALPDGRLASGSVDDTIRLWDVTSSGPEAVRLEGHSRGVGALCVLPDGQLASGSGDSTIRLWDVTSGAETASLRARSRGVTALCALPDGRLASGAGDDTIRLWDVTSCTETARLEGHSGRISALCVLSDGRLASGSGDSTIRLWELTNDAESARVGGHSDQIDALCVLPDGRLASGSWNDAIRLWNVTSGAETVRLSHSTGTLALCVLPDGRLASGSTNKSIQLWDVTSGTETARLWGHSSRIRALCVLPDGRLASGSDDKTIRLWDVTNGVETARLVGHSGPVFALCALSDGRLASGSDDRAIRMWDVTNGAVTAHLEGHANGVSALCLLPDERLASGLWDSTILLWDVTSGAATACLKGHLAPVSALCVLPDGRLVSGSSDSTIRAWDITEPREIACLEVDAPVRCLAALPDGRLIAGDDLGRWHWLEILD